MVREILMDVEGQDCKTIAVRLMETPVASVEISWRNLSGISGQFQSGFYGQTLLTGHLD